MCSVCVCLCVWLLTIVTELVTATHRDLVLLSFVLWGSYRYRCKLLHAQTYTVIIINHDGTPKTRVSVKYFTGQNPPKYTQKWAHCQASWASQLPVVINAFAVAKIISHVLWALPWATCCQAADYVLGFVSVCVSICNRVYVRKISQKQIYGSLQN